MSLNKIFSDYINQQQIFKDKNRITTSYKPDDIPHREKQIQNIARILLPALKKSRPSNIFIYGKPGTGKTTVISYVTKEMENMIRETGGENHISFVYINCKMKKVADTEYRLLAQLCRELGEDVPPTGLPTARIYDIFQKKIDERSRVVLLILDEIDELVRKVGDNFLYNLIRMNESLRNAQICIVGISNNLSFTNTLDPRVISSLSEEEVLFPPYNAIELIDIMKERAKTVFNPDVIGDGVVEKCAALAAQEHGDARRALDLLRVSGELAERESAKTISTKHVDEAEKKIDHDKVIEVIRSQPRQSQAVLWAIINNDNTNTGNIFSIYEETCKKNSLKPLTQRRISDLISELDMFGIINSEVISKGRYGRTRIIKTAIEGTMLEKIKRLLSNDFYFQ